MTDDVYVIKSPSWYGWHKVGHGDPEERLADARTWRPDAVLVTAWPGCGTAYEMEQWLHRKLEKAGCPRYKHGSGRGSEWFRCQLATILIAVDVADEAGIAFVSRAVAEKQRRDTVRQRVTEQQVQRERMLGERDAAVYAAQIAWESEQEALRSSQPQYKRPVPRFPAVIER